MDKGEGLEKLGRALLGHPQDSEAPGGFGELPAGACSTLSLKPLWAPGGVLSPGSSDSENRPQYRC